MTYQISQISQSHQVTQVTNSPTPHLAHLGSPSDPLFIPSHLTLPHACQPLSACLLPACQTILHAIPYCTPCCTPSHIPTPCISHSSHLLLTPIPHSPIPHSPIHHVKFLKSRPRGCRRRRHPHPLPLLRASHQRHQVHRSHQQIPSRPPLLPRSRARPQPHHLLLRQGLRPPDGPQQAPCPGPHFKSRVQIHPHAPLLRGLVSCAPWSPVAPRLPSGRRRPRSACACGAFRTEPSGRLWPRHRCAVGLSCLGGGPACL